MRVVDSERAHQIYPYSIYNDILSSIPGSATADTKNSALLLSLNLTTSYYLYSQKRYTSGDWRF